MSMHKTINLIAILYPIFSLFLLPSINYTFTSQLPRQQYTTASITVFILINLIYLLAYGFFIYYAFIKRGHYSALPVVIGLLEISLVPLFSLQHFTALFHIFYSHAQFNLHVTFMLLTLYVLLLVELHGRKKTGNS